MNRLRSRLIRLAHENPKFRGDILPLLRVEQGTHTAHKELLRQLHARPVTASKRKVARGELEPATSALAFWAQHIRKKKLSEDDMLKLCEQLGVPILEATPKRKRGPLEKGEKVLVDKHENTNEMNVDQCEEWHDKVGEIVSTSGGVLVVKFTHPQRAEVEFDGAKSGKTTGLYRYKEPSARGKTQLEFVYTKDPNAKPPPKSRQESIQQYLDRQDGRSMNYYSGPVSFCAKSKKGQYYMSFKPQQRSHRYANINPSKGTLYYMGRTNRRPRGLFDEVERFRAFADGQR